MKSTGRFRSIEEIRDFPVRPGLKLGQIATIEPRKSVRDWLALSRTTPTLWCRVQKESSANTVETCDRVRETLRQKIVADPRLKELGISFHFVDFGDIGAIVTNALKTLGSTAIEGGALSVLVLLFFLRRVRLTLLITLAIPLSLLLTGVWIARPAAASTARDDRRDRRDRDARRRRDRRGREHPAEARGGKRGVSPSQTRSRSKSKRLKYRSRRNTRLRYELIKTACEFFAAVGHRAA